VNAFRRTNLYPYALRGRPSREATGLAEGLLDEEERCPRWLQEMWDVREFDLRGCAEREEKKKEGPIVFLSPLAPSGPKARSVESAPL
jgi:hypothetical protein